MTNGKIDFSTLTKKGDTTQKNTKLITSYKQGFEKLFESAKALEKSLENQFGVSDISGFEQCKTSTEQCKASIKDEIKKLSIPLFYAIKTKDEVDKAIQEDPTGFDEAVTEVATGILNGESEKIKNKMMNALALKQKGPRQQHIDSLLQHSGKRSSYNKDETKQDKMPNSLVNLLKFKDTVNLLLAIEAFIKANDEIIALDDRIEKKKGAAYMKAKLYNFADTIKSAAKEASDAFISRASNFFSNLLFGDTKEKDLSNEADTKKHAVVSDVVGQKQGESVFESTLSAQDATEHTHEKYQSMHENFLAFIKAQCFNAGLNKFAAAQVCSAKQAATKGEDLNCDALYKTVEIAMSQCNFMFEKYKTFADDKIIDLVNNAPDIRITVDGDLGTTFTYKGQSFWDVFMAPALPSPEEVLSNAYDPENNAVPALGAPEQTPALPSLPGSIAPGHNDDL